jgi:hypothetical protein
MIFYDFPWKYASNPSIPVKNMVGAGDQKVLKSQIKVKAKGILLAERNAKITLKRFSLSSF